MEKYVKDMLPAQDNTQDIQWQDQGEDSFADFYEALNEACNWAFTIRQKLFSDEDIGWDEWQILGLYIDVCKVRMDKLIKIVRKCESWEGQPQAKACGFKIQDSRFKV